MARTRIRRGDFLFAWGGAAVCGFVAVTVLAVIGELSAVYAIAAFALVAILAALVAFPLALDVAALHERASQIGVDNKSADSTGYWTPVGGRLARQLQDARRRVIGVQRAIEARADDAERLIDALPEALFVLDSRRRILHANRAAEDLFGPDLVARNLAQVLRHPNVLLAVGECLAAGGSAEIELQMISPVERTMEAHIRPLPERSLGEAALLLTLQDLTLIRRAEQMRVDFVANVSHEMRTPLTSLSGFIETMQTVAKDDPASQERFLAIMAAETQRMNRLVEDLLSLSRIEMEEHNPPDGSADLRAIVVSAVDVLAPVAAENRTDIHLDIPEDLPAVVGDADQLVQVARNLMENAIKYGRPGGIVQVTGRSDGNRVSLAFQDDGEGIPAEVRYRLTERFFRVDKARSRKVGGTGLGLAIVKHIINRHRGRLQIESELGEGSTFTVHLPVRARN